ncbi:MAG: phosphate ABC transporter permease subunit PstC [Rhodobacteraceae bacterium]|nr:phosphate ABC transporter permease subunit PstC [Paracoccaceae bacterium]
MTGATLLLAVVVLVVLSFFGSSYRVSYLVEGSKKNLNSRLHYYGMFGLLCTGLPVLIAYFFWWLLIPFYFEESVVNYLISSLEVSSEENISLLLGQVNTIRDTLLSVNHSKASEVFNQNGIIDYEVMAAIYALANQPFDPETRPFLFQAGYDLWLLENRAYNTFHFALILMMICIISLYFLLVKPGFRARYHVENIVLGILIAAAGIAIITTVGIVVSLLFETFRFFDLHDWRDFFFGYTWAPNFHGDSEMSILPLLFGTFYISIFALFVAVPIGLFSAIYLAEYASNYTRSIAKPMLEVLAGIPTIVYGLFALVTFGPFLRDFFGDGGAFSVNWMSDARSVATAGTLMGMMLIPFVSSLSDDIINAVPQSLRDGSYGLGATQSETIRLVVIPAALPGIVGAILLAASRAIGETMIVVLGAGAIAKFSGNPLEAMTTITTRIVSQLTGDGDFNSPETLVAFALGLSLFLITLVLNVIALYVVRKYREQYE